MSSSGLRAPPSVPNEAHGCKRRERKQDTDEPEVVGMESNVAGEKSPKRHEQAERHSPLEQAGAPRQHVAGNGHHENAKAGDEPTQGLKNNPKPVEHRWR